VGQSQEREIFAERYAPVIRAYIAARWKTMGLDLDIDDACQDVFAECFRPDGPIHRAERAGPSGFRAFLYEVVRNVARRIEEADQQKAPRCDLPEIDRLEAHETSLSRVLDRARAVAMVREAAQRQAELADAQGADAMRRFELLQLRFHDGLSIREIARRWNIEAKKLHREYSKAKQEFLQALRDVVSAQSPMALPGEINRHCEELLEVFQ
jgi:RNA polymerase sigma-70 factor (ECF subfamily)